MKVIWVCFGIIFGLAAVTSCSHKLKKPEWVFEKTALRLHVKADNRLNLYNNKAHTLYVCFFQLEELNTFDKLTEDAGGIRQLLECRLFDGSVAAASSKVIHAGEDIVLTLDRAERAKYFTMVAGYSSTLTNERVVRRHKFQVRKSLKRFLKREYACEPCKLDVEVSLGPKQVEYSKIIPDEELKCYDECK